MAHSEEDNSLPNTWEDIQRMERERKKHLNQSTTPNNPIPESAFKKDMNSQMHLGVWGGWGQAKPKIKLPPALGKLGFPFIPPAPPPPSEAERLAIEFRRKTANMPPSSGLT